MCKMWETRETTCTVAWINKERSSRCADSVAWRESGSLGGKGHLLHLSRHMRPSKQASAVYSSLCICSHHSVYMHLFWHHTVWLVRVAKAQVYPSNSISFKCPSQENLKSALGCSLTFLKGSSSKILNLIYCWIQCQRTHRIGHKQLSKPTHRYLNSIKIVCSTKWLNAYCIFTLQSAGEDYNEFGVNLGRALNHYQFMSYRQAETLVSFSEGMKGPLSVFFTAALNSLVPHLCAQPSAWLPLLLCQFYWLDISHMVVIVDGHVQAEPRYWSRHTKQILFMLTSCWW